MTENLFLVVIALIMAGIQEILLHPLLVKIHWADKLTLSRRVFITWPILTFLLYSILLAAYVGFFEHYPQGFSR